MKIKWLLAGEMAWEGAQQEVFQVVSDGLGSQFENGQDCERFLTHHILLLDSVLCCVSFRMKSIPKVCMVGSLLIHSMSR